MGARRSATKRTCTPTCSARPMTASRSAAAASPTASAREPTARVRPQRQPSRACARSLIDAVPGDRRRRPRARLVGGPRRAPRLVRLGRGRSRARTRVGRRLRRRGRRRREPLRANPARPDPRAPERAHDARLGWALARARGSPSRCAGARSAPSTRCIAAPIGSSSARSAQLASADSSTLSPAASSAAPRIPASRHEPSRYSPIRPVRSLVTDVEPAALVALTTTSRSPPTSASDSFNVAFVASPMFAHTFVTALHSCHW